MERPRQKARRARTPTEPPMAPPKVTILCFDELVDAKVRGDGVDEGAITVVKWEGVASVKDIANVQTQQRQRRREENCVTVAPWKR